MTIVDANGCDYRSSVQRIETPPNISLTSNTSTGTCATGAEVTIDVVTGAPNFTYSIFGQPLTAVGPTPATSHTFTGLEHGTTYLFQVEDAGNCFSVIEVTTPTISAINISALTTTDVACNGDSTGAVDFTVSDYDASVTALYYEVRDQLTNLPIAPPVNGTFVGLTGAPASGTITGLAAGNYTLFVEETNGTLCSASQAFQITEPIQALSASVTDNVNANCNTGAQVTITATGGTGPYQYAYAPSPTVPTVFNGNNVLNLDPAIATNWDIIVRDANGCEFPLSVIIAEDAVPTIDPVASQCYVGSPLNVTLSGTTYNGTATYSTGGPFQTSPNFTITTPGTYTFSIRDDNGCVATTPYVVNDQLILSAALTKDLDCTASPDATITLTATGGDSSYTYEVSTDGGATYSPMGSNVYTATTAGTYTFRVTDGAGCEDITTYVLDPIEAIVFTTTETNVSCNGGSDGSITVNVTGGVGPFQYQLDSGALQNSNVFTGLSQGTTYIITVTDAKSCTLASAPITISEPTVLTASETLSVNTTCDVETIITVLGQDGTPTGSGTGYYYNFNGTGFTTTNTYTVNNNGSIQTVNYIVRDANGCEVTGSVNVDPLDPPTDLDFSATAITCLVTTSDVTLTATNGVAPLSYEILSPASAITSNTTGVFTGLPADDYMFQVTDGNGCTYQELYTVADVENIAVTGALISDVTCNPGANGEVLFTISNFAGTYSYSINGAPTVTGQSSPTVTVSGLTGPSTQTILVTDETTGCSATTSVDVSQPAALGLTLDTNINATCNMGAQVSVTASEVLLHMHTLL
ncbi:SprB repeat-containing protein [Lacinutrix neustonica]|uniref:SprB repeat-containing protein n=1 Tax=Lacinutrix neustonica TaxID=2980107 RepID=A0A9E8MVP0_9FLAO|nr:SprB repeat-containing protein [Lacinutrix neustonica]WAC02216.1 SprB repeat-containing protein [Lacinutrix neustonica]